MPMSSSGAQEVQQQQSSEPQQKVLKGRSGTGDSLKLPERAARTVDACLVGDCDQALLLCQHDPQKPVGAVERQCWLLLQPLDWTKDMEDV